jgi:hypothetical protein
MSIVPATLLGIMAVSSAIIVWFTVRQVALRLGSGRRSLEAN